MVVGVASFLASVNFIRSSDAQIAKPQLRGKLVVDLQIETLMLLE